MRHTTYFNENVSLTLFQKKEKKNLFQEQY